MLSDMSYQVLNSYNLISTTAEDLSAAAADHGKLLVCYPARVIEFGFPLTEATAGATTVPVVSLDLLDRDGTTRTEKATITFATEAIGVVPRRKLLAEGNDFEVENGQWLVFEHKTAASGGTTTGAGHYYVVLEALPGAETKRQTEEETVTA